MGFDIRLVYDIKPVLVGQLIPIRVVGVVAGPDRIDVELLHQADVFFHRSPDGCDGIFGT